ncbi:MAG TPA: hypothetical protein VID48_13015 [Solirubrobacteraceae bacterium]
MITSITIVRAHAHPVAAYLHRPRVDSLGMSPTWIWMQFAIVLFVLIGMVLAITKLV